MKNKKVLFYINKISDGGAEKVMANLANQFARANHPTLLVTSFKSADEYELDQRIKYCAISEQYQSQGFIQRNIIAIRGLRSICRRERPDVVIAFMGENNFRAILATLFLPIKTILSIRSDPNKEYASRFFKLAAKTLYPLGDGFVFQTEKARSWFSLHIQQKSVIMPNQVDEAFFQLQYDGLRRDIVAVGRLDTPKNFPMLINAFSLIASDFPDENLLIFGEGNLRPDLQNLIDQLGLEKRVLLKGYTANVAKAIQSAKILALSSDYEGMPNAILEAMAIGIPVVSTDCPSGGPGTLIQSEENGVLIPVGDVQAMSHALKDLLNDDQKRIKLAVNGQKTAKSFAPEVVFKLWSDYVDKVTATARRFA